MRLFYLCFLVAIMCGSHAAVAQDEFGGFGGFDGGNGFPEPQELNPGDFYTPSVDVEMPSALELQPEMSVPIWTSVNEVQLPQSWEGFVTPFIPDPSPVDAARAAVVQQLAAFQVTEDPVDSEMARIKELLDQYQFLLGDDLYCGPTSMCDSVRSGPVIFKGSGGAAGGFSPLGSINGGGGGATAATDFTFPYVVALLEAGTLQCTGILIGPQTVLTAAHCICGAKIDEAFVGSTVFVDAPNGVGDFRSLPVRSDYKLASIPQCVAGAEGVEARGEVDLGLLYLTEPLEWQWTDFPSLASPEDLVNVPTVATAVGFGASEKTNQGGVKRFAELPLQFCNEAAAEEYGCAVGRDWVSIPVDSSPADTCYGDSGGPLLVNIGETMRLIGVTLRKRAGGNNQYCGSGGVYAAVAGPTAGPIQTWLEDNLQ